MSSPDNLIEEYKHLSNEKKEMVYHIALKYLSKNEEMAADVTQDVLMKWLEYIQKGYEIQNLNAWLAIVTKNTAMTYRAQTQRDAEIRKLMSDFVEGYPSAEDEVIVREEDIDLEKEILDALYDKSPRWHEAMVMAYCMKLEHKKIADHFGISVPAMDMLLKRAREW